MGLEREIRFLEGFDCIKFECRFNSKSCIPGMGGSHGLHGLEIAFYIKGEKGAVQFKLSTGWTPQRATRNRINVLELKPYTFSDVFPLPTDLGYHSYEPHFEGQEPIADSCDVLNGKPCYYDGSTLNANDAFYTLINGGDIALWDFLEQYYKYVFEKGNYPIVYEYPKEARL